LVREQAGNGLTQAAFCRQRQIVLPVSLHESA